MPRDTLKLADGWQIQFAMPRPAHDGFAQRMLRAHFDRRSKPQQRLVVKIAQGHDIGDIGFTARQRTRFVEHHGVELAGTLQHLGTADEDTGLGALADADHQRGGRRHAKRAGAGDDEHGDEGEKPLREIARDPPAEEGEEGDNHHRGDEVARHLVGNALHLRSARLRFFDQPDDLRQRGILADTRRLEMKQPTLVERPANDGRPRLLDDGHRLARQQRLIDRRTAFDHFAVGWYSLARAYDNDLFGHDRLSRNLCFNTVTDDMCNRWPKVHQLAHRRRGALLDDLFHVSAEQDEGDDDGRNLEIDVALLDLHRQNIGCEHHGDTVEIGHGRTERDQEIHVDRAAADRSPCALVEAPPADELDRRHQDEQPDAPGKPRQCRNRCPADYCCPCGERQEGPGTQDSQCEHPSECQRNAGAHLFQFAFRVLEDLLAGGTAEIIGSAAASCRERGRLVDHHPADGIPSARLKSNSCVAAAMVLVAVVIHRLACSLDLPRSHKRMKIQRPSQSRSQNSTFVPLTT